MLGRTGVAHYGRRCSWAHSEGHIGVAHYGILVGGPLQLRWQPIGRRCLWAHLGEVPTSYTSKCKNVKINTRGDNRRKVVGICYIDLTYNWFLLLRKVSTLWELVWMLLYVPCSKLPCTCSKRPEGAKIPWFYHQPYPPPKKLNENHQCCLACEMLLESFLKNKTSCPTSDGRGFFKQFIL